MTGASPVATRRRGVLEVVEVRVGDGEDRAGPARQRDELVDRERRLGQVRAARVAQPLVEQPSPVLRRVLAHDLGVQLEHRLGEVRSADGVLAVGARHQVLEGQPVKAQLAEARQEGVVALVAVAAQRG